MKISTLPRYKAVQKKNGKKKKNKNFTAVISIVFALQEKLNEKLDTNETIHSLSLDPHIDYTSTCQLAVKKQN